MDVCFSTIIGVPLTLDFGNSVKLYSILPTFLGQGQGLLECDGPVWVRRPAPFMSPSLLYIDAEPGDV